MNASRREVFQINFAVSLRDLGLEGPEAGDPYRSCHALELAFAQLLDLGHRLGRGRQPAAHQHLAVLRLGTNRAARLKTAPIAV